MGCVSIRSAVERLDCFDAAYSDIGTKEDRAAVVCSEAVRQNSISPATYRHVRGWVSGDMAFVVFDAQNMYGALLRHSASCRFAKSSEGWRLESPTEFVISAVSLGSIPVDQTSLQEPPRPESPNRESPKVILPSPGEVLERDVDRQKKCVSALDLMESDVAEAKKWPNPDGSTTLFIYPVAGKAPFKLGVCDYTFSGRLTVRVNK
ncbi:hypothetical protein [Pleomorphomonas sp. JP5]|uniref:hypothetical protein n=1 Tax=Pleomorphomonas sp. JP5 TaxID=2942998 RepID=UPI00204336BA|nr:hypothetical protein [Pleomorphomonas sp. JP5]MCM5556308.1 hypothetical protein [Pleomorphomonas sp. JP5]